MAYTDKKNAWWRINNSDDDFAVKTYEIFHDVLSKFPTLEIKGSCALIVVKDVKIYLSIHRCIGIGNRVLLRYSTDERSWAAKSLKSCKPNTGEVRESHKYSDGSSRIDLDYAFKQIGSFVDIKAAILDKIKKERFIKQLGQMKLVGRIKELINNELYDVYANPENIDRVSISDKSKSAKATITKNGTDAFIVGFNSIGYMHVKDSEFNDFIKDIQGFLKYV